MLLDLWIPVTGKVDHSICVLTVGEARSSIDVTQRAMTELST
jgi:hypothetical protein